MGEGEEGNSADEFVTSWLLTCRDHERAPSAPGYFGMKGIVKGIDQGKGRIVPRRNVGRKTDRQREREREEPA